MRYRHFKQSLTITGLGGSNFENGLTVLEQLALLIEKETKLEVDSGSPIFCGGHRAMDIGNRYLTPRGETDGSDHVTIPETYDPKKILSGMRGDDYVFTRENMVAYTERKTEGAIYTYVNTTYSDPTYTKRVLDIPRSVLE